MGVSELLYVFKQITKGNPHQIVSKAEQTASDLRGGCICLFMPEDHLRTHFTSYNDAQHRVPNMFTPSYSSIRRTQLVQQEKVRVICEQCGADVTT